MMLWARVKLAVATVWVGCTVAGCGLEAGRNPAAADGTPPATRPAAAASTAKGPSIPFVIAPNTWVDAKLKFVLPADIPDAQFVHNEDGYCGSTYRSKAGTVLWRTGVSSKAGGFDPAFYSNAILEWAPAEGEARVIDVQKFWGGGAYGGGKLLPGFKDHVMPAPRHVYDAFDYVEAQDAVYMLFGSYSRMKGKSTTPEATEQLKVDEHSTWKYSFAEKRWVRIDSSPQQFFPAGRGPNLDGLRLQYWPEAGKILCVYNYSSSYAQFDLKTEKWESIVLEHKFVGSHGPALTDKDLPQEKELGGSGGPGSSTWDSKRQLWVVRCGPNVTRFDPKARKREDLPPAYEVTDARKFKYNGYLGTSITYIPRHDVYLIHCPNGNDTYVYEIEKGRWKSVRGGDVSLEWGNLEYDPKTDLTCLTYQRKAFRFRYVPAE